MTVRGRLLFVVVLAALLPACGLGDPAEKVDIENTTSIPLRIYQDGFRRELPLDIAPHTTAKTAFMWPIDRFDSRTRAILAEDASGKRIYCERFAYADLVRVRWKITIIERDLCEQGSSL
jgi:hypothetical protein